MIRFDWMDNKSLPTRYQQYYPRSKRDRFYNLRYLIILKFNLFEILGSHIVTDDIMAKSSCDFTMVTLALVTSY